jgi:hypothetical protein
MPTFPAVKGANLEGRTFTLPADFEGELNLVIVAFQRWHQSLVDTWLPIGRELQRALPGLRIYELPTIQRLNFLARKSIDFGMRMGIPDKAVREATITLYLDKEAFRTELEVSNEETIRLFLVRRGGEILWRGEGPNSDETRHALVDALAAAAEGTNV